QRAPHAELGARYFHCGYTMAKIWTSAAWGVLLAGTVVGGAGCGGKKPVKVEGTVTLDGEPLAGVTVSFRPKGDETGRSANGMTGSDGTFRLTTFMPNDGALPGEYTIVVIQDEIPAGPDVASVTPQDLKQMGQVYVDTMQQMEKNKANKAGKKLP